MPSTTIHFPDEILRRLDEAAGEHGISRNRYVLEACKEALDREEGHWPEGFFDSELSDEDQSLLHEGAAEMEEAIYSYRRNRGAPLL
jgi:predicted transcriptional regulator